MLTFYIYARLQERSKDFCVCVLGFMCVLGKGSNKVRWGSWKTGSYFPIHSPQRCKKGLFTQMLQQLFEVMVMFFGIAVAVTKNSERSFIHPSKLQV